MFLHFQYRGLNYVSALSVEVGLNYVSALSVQGGGAKICLHFQ